MTERDVRKVAHATLQKYERDLAAFSFNTVVSGMMEFTNALFKARDAGLVGTPAWREASDMLLLMIAPIAPYMSEELWSRLGRGFSIHQQSWPVFDASAVIEETLTIVVQINGKVRDRVVVDAAASEEAIKQAALDSDGARKFLADKPPKQVVYVKGRLVSIVL